MQTGLFRAVSSHPGKLRTLAILENVMTMNDNDPNSSRNGTAGFAGSDRQDARTQEGPQGAPVSEIERKLLSAAEELGTWLGTAERKTTEFLGQQKTITDQLVRIRDTAARLLAQIEQARERSRSELPPLLRPRRRPSTVLRATLSPIEGSLRRGDARRRGETRASSGARLRFPPGGPSGTGRSPGRAGGVA